MALRHPQWRESAEEKAQATHRTDPVLSGLEEVFEEISIQDFAGSMSLSFSDPKFEPPSIPSKNAKPRITPMRLPSS